MTPRERFLAALNGAIPDRVSVHEHLFSRRLLKEILGYETVLYDEIPTQNVLAMIRAANEYGTYSQ